MHFAAGKPILLQESGGGCCSTSETLEEGRGACSGLGSLPFGGASGPDCDPRRLDMLRT